MMQIITGAIIVSLTALICVMVIINTGFVDKFYNLGLNYESVEFAAMSLLLTYSSFSLLCLVRWFWKEPRVNFRRKRRKTAKQIMDKYTKNIPKTVRY